MLPVKIANYFDKPPPPQQHVGPGRLRPASPQPPKLVVVQGVAPDVDRRMGNRRTMERREKEQALFLDTRTPQGRRRNPGRRAEDQLAPEDRKTISIKA
ncbi:MAG: hypothetical protein WKG03_08630 [Telluria sp.]